MKPSAKLRSLYTRVSRDRECITFRLVNGPDEDRSCIFCDDVTQEAQAQSVYSPPIKVAEKLLSEDRKGQTAYCCVNHYYRYNRMVNNGHLFPSFEDFYITAGPVTKRKQRATVEDDSLKFFRTTTDLGTSGYNEQTVWYSGFGFMDQIRVRHPLYLAFAKYVHDNAILGLLAEGRRSLFQQFCAENEVNEKELRAFEHFLKL